MLKKANPLTREREASHLKSPIEHVQEFHIFSWDFTAHYRVLGISKDGGGVISLFHHDIWAKWDIDLFRHPNDNQCHDDTCYQVFSELLAHAGRTS